MKPFKYLMNIIYFCIILNALPRFKFYNLKLQTNSKLKNLINEKLAIASLLKSKDINIYKEGKSTSKSNNMFKADSIDTFVDSIIDTDFNAQKPQTDMKNHEQNSDANNLKNSVESKSENINPFQKNSYDEEKITNKLNNHIFYSNKLLTDLKNDINTKFSDLNNKINNLSQNNQNLEASNYYLKNEKIRTSNANGQLTKSFNNNDINSNVNKYTKSGDINIIPVYQNNKATYIDQNSINNSEVDLNSDFNEQALPSSNNISNNNKQNINKCHENQSQNVNGLIPKQYNDNLNNVQPNSNTNNINVNNQSMDYKNIKTNFINQNFENQIFNNNVNNNHQQPNLLQNCSSIKSNENINYSGNSGVNNTIDSYNNKAYQSNLFGVTNNNTIINNISQNTIKTDLDACFTDNFIEQQQYWKNELNDPNLRNYIISSNTYCTICCQHKLAQNFFSLRCCQEKCDIINHKAVSVSLDCLSSFPNMLNSNYTLITPSINR